MHLALVLCVIAGSATLTGALLVGDSMRGSLRENAIARLGPYAYAMRSGRYVTKSVSDSVPNSVGALILSGSIEQADRQTRANRIQILGVDAEFWQGWPRPRVGKPSFVNLVSDLADGRGVVLNRSLADEIGTRVGDDVLIRLPRASAVPTESVLGRPDEAAVSARLTVRRIIATTGAGGFSLDPSQTAPFNVFLHIDALQRAVEREGRVNTILVRSPETQGDATAATTSLQDQLDAHLGLADLDLRLRQDPSQRYVALESERLLIEPAVETAVHAASRSNPDRIGRVFSYLANSITALDSNGETGNQIPYSIVSAIDGRVARELFGDRGAGESEDAGPLPGVGPDGIVLNQSAQRSG